MEKVGKLKVKPSPIPSLFYIVNEEDDMRLFAIYREERIIIRPTNYYKSLTNSSHEFVEGENQFQFTCYDVDVATKIVRYLVRIAKLITSEFHKDLEKELVILLEGGKKDE